MRRSPSLNSAALATNFSGILILTTCCPPPTQRSGAGEESYAILLLNSPIPSIHTFTTSPALRNSPLSAPVPDGVPVRIRSPGCSVMLMESCAICSASVNNILVELESCLSTSLTQSFSSSRCGSAISLAGTIQGPIGQEPSKLLCLVQSILKNEVSSTPGRRPRSRAEKSLATVYP